MSMGFGVQGLWSADAITRSVPMATRSISLATSCRTSTSGRQGFANLEVTHAGARYRLSFVDPGNITQGLTGQGEDAGHFAEPGMVAVQEISEEHPPQRRGEAREDRVF